MAIKVLADTTPRKLFVREIGIWKSLHHANVLPLYGASSATGDPPWFFVSPYMKNGSLAEHLKRVETEERPLGLGVGVGANQAMTSMPPRSQGGRATTLPSPWFGLQPAGSSSGSLSPPGAPKKHLPGDTGSDVQRQWDLFRFMHEIAKGMEYLHSKDILHGDLKASNVLVDNKYRCVISDFGLSEMKSEAFRISGTPPPRAFFFLVISSSYPAYLFDQTERSDGSRLNLWQVAVNSLQPWTFGLLASLALRF